MNAKNHELKRSTPWLIVTNTLAMFPAQHITPKTTEIQLQCGGQMKKRQSRAADRRGEWLAEELYEKGII
jgi:hypothetical protein